MMKYVKFLTVMLAASLAGCQTAVVYNYDYAEFQAQRVNTYHNVHYNNKGFYPRVDNQNGVAYSMRGYRY